MKSKCSMALTIIIIIIGVAIFVLLSLNELGTIEIAKPNLIFSTYKGKPVYDFIEPSEPARWYDLDMNGTVYTHKGSTPWRPRAMGDIVGYGQDKMGLFTIRALKDDPNVSYIQMDAKWGKGKWSEFYHRDSIDPPLVDEQTVDEIRFYQGEDHYDDTYKEKSEMKLSGSTRDKNVIKRLLDEMLRRDGNDPIGRSGEEYLGVLQFLSDDYPMLECAFTVWRDRSGEYNLFTAVEDEGERFLQNDNYVVVSPEIFEAVTRS